MDNHIFRSAFSGFNRQDVMDYIEKTQKQSEDRIAGLESRLEELPAVRQELDERTAERDELQKQLEEMTIRCNHARNNWDAQSQAKEAFRQDVTQRDATIRDLTAENQRLQRQVAALEGQMQDLRREKEQLAQLELDARRRSEDLLSAAGGQAQALEAEAQKQAGAITAQARRQAEETIAQANERAGDLLQEAEDRLAAFTEQYDRILRSFQTIAAHVSGEVQKLDAITGQLPGGFNRLKESLLELQEQAKER